jgi:hypothetical protein
VSTHEPWQRKTPHNLAEFEQQAHMVRTSLQHHLSSLSSHTKTVIEKVFKACEMATPDKLLAGNENKDLRYLIDQLARKRVNEEADIKENKSNSCKGSGTYPKHYISFY